MSEKPECSHKWIDVVNTIYDVKLGEICCECNIINMATATYELKRMVEIPERHLFNERV